MNPWNELRPLFLEALNNAFTVDELQSMLRRPPCEKELEQLTSKNKARPLIVEEVIAKAERDGWLDKLARGALEANREHSRLRQTVPPILEGIETLGRPYYQLPDKLPPVDSIYNELRLYLQWMRDKSSNLPLGPLDPSGRESDLIGLNDVFVALDVDKPGQTKLADGSDGVYKAALGHLHEQSHLVLLGDPGSGKSTLLRYLSLYLCNALLDKETEWLSELEWTVTETEDEERGGLPRALGERDEEEKREQRHWQRSGLVPVYVQLRDFARQPFDPADGAALFDFACDQLPEPHQSAKPYLEALALHRRLLFMFDGVDEVPPQERKQVWQAIGALVKSPYGGNRWVTTCRTLSYVEEELPRRHLPVVTLQKLDQEQIDRFIGSWYQALQAKHELTPDEARYMTEALQGASRGHLYELAQNPMLLTIMAIVQTYEGELPEERAKLYQACVETLLLRWQRDKDKNAPSILQQLDTTQAQLEQLLWRLGWEAHSKARQRERAADLQEWDVIKTAREQLGSLEKAELFLTYTEKKAHLLVGSGGADDLHFTFPHRTFQEYLAACYLESERRPLRRIAELAEAGDPWREVLNLAFGRLMHVKNDRVKAIDIVVDRLMLDEQPDDEEGWRRVWLTGEACAVIGQDNLLEDEEGAEILPRIRGQLVALLENEALTPQQRAEAGDALGKLGDPRPGVRTLEPDLIRIDAGKFIYQKGKYTITEPFAVARYPVTVAQFAMFMADGGYEEPRYWGGEDGDGWQWRVQKHPDYRGEGPVTQPEYWLQPRWHVENRPIVGVSWYEAQAYCAWLSERAEREYRLPREEEWERAARHMDGREWAWGNDWADGIINTSEAKIGRTTTVGAFPRGVAECGAHDMSGNVWEWTSTPSETGGMRLRGGAWLYDRVGARVALRNLSGPDDSFSYIGFRVVAPVF